ncbi:rCG35768 [Rattus norvegicus]|uniref:RCG35768 n=1 Tax=Rattus norvegicus TaxID=10116 RepID=A6IK64_RAT|nr:rCG35768 [Rattus norvegicus]
MKRLRRTRTRTRRPRCRMFRAPRSLGEAAAVSGPAGRVAPERPRSRLPRWTRLRPQGPAGTRPEPRARL